MTKDKDVPMQLLCITVGHMLHVHSPDGSTFLCEITSWPPSWNYNVIQDILDYPIWYFILFFLLAQLLLKKSLRFRRFRSDQDEIWQDCSLTSYPSVDGVGYLVWQYFKMLAMTQFRPEKCCYMVCAHASHAWHWCIVAVKEHLCL